MASVHADMRIDDPIRRLFYQLTRMTKDRGALRHDDRVDVLALSVECWATQMARDVRKAEEDHRRKLREQEIRKFLKAAGVPGIGSRLTYAPRVIETTRLKRRGFPRRSN